MSTGIDQLTKLYAALKQQQDLWLPDWRDLSDMYKSTVSTWLYDKRQSERAGRRNKKIINGAGVYSKRVLQAGLMSGLSSPSRPWFKCVVPDPELMEYAPVSRWLYAVQNRVMDIFARSNFYDVLQQGYGDWGVFGNMAFQIDEAGSKVINCVPYAIGSYYVAANEDGVIDTTFRRTLPTVKQMVGKYGLDKCSKAVKSDYQNGNYYKTYEVITAILPNEDAEYGSKLSKDMAFKSCAWQPGEKDFLLESGYEEKPTITARWELDSAEDVIGIGPGLMGLGAARALQLQEKRKAAAIDKHLDPPLAADSSLRNEVVSLVSGDITYAGFQQNGSPKVTPIYQTQPRIDGLMEDIQELKQEINKAMFTDVFMMLANDARAQPPTAEEIRARETERMLMLGPVVERGNTEIYQVAFDRAFSIAVRRSMPYWQGILHGEPLLPPPPEELQGIPLKVELISILAQAQKTVGLSGIERMASYVGQMAQAQAAIGVQPTAQDKFNVDQSIDEYALALGVPPTIVNSDDEVAAIRQQRAEAQAQAQQAAQAEQQAKTMNQGAQAAQRLSQTQVNGSSALDQLVGIA